MNAIRRHLVVVLGLLIVPSRCTSCSARSTWPLIPGGYHFAAIGILSAAVVSGRSDMALGNARGSVETAA